MRWSEHDIRKASDKDKAIEYIRQQDRRQAFNLTQPGLFRLHLIQHNEELLYASYSVHITVFSMGGVIHYLLNESMRFINMLLMVKLLHGRQKTGLFCCTNLLLSTSI